MQINVHHDEGDTTVSVVDPRSGETVKSVSVPHGHEVTLTCANEHEADGISIGTVTEFAPTEETPAPETPEEGS